MPRISVVHKTSFFHRHKVSLLLIIGIFSAISIGGIASFGVFYFRVQEVKIIRDSSDLNLRYANIQQMLDHAKGKNLFVLSKVFLEAQLKITFPELSEIKISKKFPRILEVNIKTENLVFKWIYRNSQTPGTQYFGYVSSNGRFFLHGPEEIFTVFENDTRDDFIEPVTKILSEEEITEILGAREQLESVIHKKIPEMLYLPKAQEIHFIDENQTQYWIFLKRDISEQIQKLNRALSVREIFKTPLAYIDLRIGRKVIYKKK